jgi:hypothetical protein
MSVSPLASAVQSHHATVTPLSTTIQSHHATESPSPTTTQSPDATPETSPPETATVSPVATPGVTRSDKFSQLIVFHISGNIDKTALPLSVRLATSAYFRMSGASLFQGTSVTGGSVRFYESASIVSSVVFSVSSLIESPSSLSSFLPATVCFVRTEGFTAPVTFLGGAFSSTSESAAAAVQGINGPLIGAVCAAIAVLVLGLIVAVYLRRRKGSSAAGEMVEMKSVAVSESFGITIDCAANVFSQYQDDELWTGDGDGEAHELNNILSDRFHESAFS